jgi:YD repeat-containing protein
MRTAAYPFRSRTHSRPLGDAAASWASWFNSHDGSGQFVVQQRIGGPVTIPITLKNGGGTIAGQTKLSYDQQGFVSAATVQISAKSFGIQNSSNTV